MDKKTKKYVIKGGVAIIVIALAGLGVFMFVRGKKNLATGLMITGKEEQKLVGKKVHFGPEGYVNVRNSPKVDNENWRIMDFSHNLLTQVDTNPVGTIMERVKGEDGYYWYKIKLTQPFGDKTEGYVREDAVTVQFKQ